ncbi:MAG TPA: TrkA family potassium uptake protein [Anaerolineae bacterium]|nr:TrkA family potassium uptake protein [Anaerolineae bacterium]
MVPYRYVVIVGCGRVGSMLANRLSGLGSNVVIVDRDETAFDNLSPEFSGFRVLGEAAELATLRQAGIERADCLLAVTSHDNVNLMVAQMARATFGVTKVMARVFDPAREGVYREFGIETVNPATASVDLFLLALEKGSGAGQR